MKIDNLTPRDVTLQELGKRLARVRKQRDLTQTQLARDAGIGVATLRRIEAGQDSQMESWLKLLQALGMSAAINALLPEDFKSPMAQVRAHAKRRKSNPSASIWGDENS